MRRDRRASRGGCILPRGLGRLKKASGGAACASRGSARVCACGRSLRVACNDARERACLRASARAREGGRLHDYNVRRARTCERARACACAAAVREAASRRATGALRGGLPQLGGARLPALGGRLQLPHALFCGPPGRARENAGRRAGGRWGQRTWGWGRARGGRVRAWRTWRVSVAARTRVRLFYHARVPRWTAPAVRGARGTRPRHGRGARPALPLPFRPRRACARARRARGGAPTRARHGRRLRAERVRGTCARASAEHRRR